MSGCVGGLIVAHLRQSWARSGQGKGGTRFCRFRPVIWNFCLLFVATPDSEWTVETSHQDGLGEHMTIHRSHDLGARRVGSKAQLRVQCIKLECVVMIDIASCARSHEAVLLAGIERLDRAIGQAGLIWYAFRQRCRRSGNIESHPVQHFVGGVLQCGIGIVYY